MIPTDTAGAAPAPGDGELPVVAPDNIEIDISVRHPAWRGVGDLAGICRAAVHRTLESAGASLPAVPVEISLVFADADFVATLNQAHRGKQGPTNVLSFPASEPGDIGLTLLGDVVLGFEVVEAEARAGNLPLSHHTTHLLVHGILHLLGYDHILDKDADIMEALEVSILQRLNIADPYATQNREAEH